MQNAIKLSVFYAEWHNYVHPFMLNVVILNVVAVNYRSNFNPTFIGIKYPNNLPSYNSNLLPFQGKFNVMKTTTVS
jgi:hypothetical protein